jgi:hypothetical protein
MGCPSKQNTIIIFSIPLNIPLIVGDLLSQSMGLPHPSSEIFAMTVKISPY